MLSTARFLNRRPELTPRQRASGRRIWRQEHKAFQWKYTAFLIAAVFGAVALFMAATSYQLYQNYAIFKKLAFDTNPELISYLERELTEFNLFMVATLAFVFTFCLVLGLRMTTNIIRPLIHLERHMKKVTSGDWSSPDFRYHEEEDLSGLLDTYAYMFRSLRAHTESEINLLEKLSVDTKNRESMGIWKSLIQQKRAQLNLPGHPLPTAETGEEILPLPAIRRVS